MKNLIPFLILALHVSFLSAQTNCSSILNCPAPGTPSVQFCDFTTNDENFWNDQGSWDPANFQKDLGEKGVDLNLTTVSTCGPLQVQAFLYFDLIGDGVWETVWNSNNPAPTQGEIYFDNSTVPGFGGSDTYIFDTRPVPGNQKWTFKVVTTTSGDTTFASIRWENPSNPGVYVLPEMPVGLQKIKWVITDGNANQLVCEHTYNIKDCKAPTVVCLNGLIVNIMPTQQIQLWAPDFLQYAEDNLTPSAYIQYGIRRAGAGTGFPVDANGNPQGSVTFTCADIGLQTVELWAADKSGNADYCLVGVEIQDNFNACDPIGGGDSIWACLKRWCDGAPVISADLAIIGTHPALPQFNIFMSNSTINAQGCISLDPQIVPPGSNYTLTPVLESNPKNGVDVFDLIRIARHVLGIEPLGSPYALIASDANKSGSVTAFDVVETMKLILGYYTDFPSNTSWRFVDADYNFPNAANPFQTVFPESVQMSNTSAVFDFKAIKIGDVDCSGTPGLQANSQDRSATVLTSPNLTLMPGEEAVINLTTNSADSWLGLQGSWSFDPAQLEVVSVESDVLPGFTPAYTYIQPGIMRVIWFSPTPVNLDNGTAVFRLRIRANSAINMSDVLHENNDLIGMVVNNAQEVKKLIIEFQQSSATSAPAETSRIYPAQPNPTTGSAQIPVEISANEKISVELYDQTGRLMWRRDETLGAGKHLLDIPANAMPAAGLYLWRIQSPNLSGSGKLVRE